MADQTNNSLSTQLEQFYKLYNNSIEVFSKLNEATTTTNKTVAVDLFDDDGNLKRINIPSFGYLKREIERLDKNNQNLAGVGDSDTNVRMADGSFRKIVASKLKTPASDITELFPPQEFDSKSNWFFEDFLNPLLFISVDLTGQVPSDTERVLVRRYLLDLDTETKRRYFNNNYKGRSNIGFDDFIDDLLSENIEFTLDEEVRDMPPRNQRYRGDFSIIKISDFEETELIDGNTVTRRGKKYKLDRLTYSDAEAGFENTESLKINDQLIANNGLANTRYKVTLIDTSTNTVELEIIEGFQGLSTGVAQLSIYKGINDDVSVDIPIGFDKNIVTFIKPVDAESKIIASNWSPGIAFYSNELEISDVEGNTQTLDTYYRNEVVDFGLFLLSMAKDKMQPSAIGLTPNAPEFTETDLSVVQINNHLTDSDAVTEIKELANERNRLQTEIKELDIAIRDKNSSIVSKDYGTNDIEKERDQNELSSLIKKRQDASQLFASVVRNIETKAEADDIVNARPKYRVRGFIPVPEARVSVYTGPQEIVGFEYEYRYLSESGKGNNSEQITYNDNGVEKQGSFSTWVRRITPVRERIKNDAETAFKWKDETVSDADQLNSNQLDIPIQRGESVEIRIRSISEAGYPSNPLKSDWSETSIIPFPPELLQSNAIERILEENKESLTEVKFTEQLQVRGVTEHISDSLSRAGQYFAHRSQRIDSGFLNDNEEVISLYSKLVEFQDRIATLEARLNNVKGELRVRLLGEDGREFIIEKDKSHEIFAGYYKDIVADLDIKKGAIVSKTYFLIIENNEAGELELLSRIAGDSSLPVYTSGNKFSDGDPDDEVDSDNYYQVQGKYDYVPILYTNPSDTTNSYISESPYQSQQLRGQYVFNRWKDVAGTTEFYIDFDADDDSNTIESIDDGEYRYEAITFGDVGTDATDFVWNGTYNSDVPEPTPLANATSIYDAGQRILLHIDHPLLNDGATSTPTELESGRGIVNAKPAKLVASDTYGKMQNGYFFDTDQDRPLKIAFEPDDQYTLGKASVGSYLFMAPVNESELIVEGISRISKKRIRKGPKNAIRIPIVFQFRMTDYGGVGSNGIGFVGGDRTGSTRDVKYSKCIGIDLFDKDEDMFSFDIKFNAEYRSRNLNLDKVPSKDLSVALNDLTEQITNINPDISTR